MRLVIQRVSRASVTIGTELRSSIGAGLMVLVGVAEGDNPDDARWLAAKTVAMRIFPDDKGVMNRSVIDCGGDILAVSQFTLNASTRKGNRPSYIHAAGHALAVPLYGSRLTPYVDGKTKMDALLEAIAGARHHIHIQYYIFSDDETGRRLRDALTAKAREGVEVRILYDDVGCTGVKKAFFEGMRADGIEAYSFLHVKFPRFTSKVNYRNHRKIGVIDGRIGFIGGMNVADRYVLGIERGNGKRERWRDTHFRIEGSGVAGLQASFLSDWSATTKQAVGGPAYFPAPERLTDNVMQIVPSGPLGKWRTLLQAVEYAVSRAAQRVWIETPYYLPSETLNAALQEAALAGIDVRLMLPERSDSRVGATPTWTTWCRPG